MATAQSKLSILVEAKNNASGSLKQVQDDVKNLDKAAGNIAKGMGGLLGAAGVAGLGALAIGTVELSRMGAEAERLGFAFDSLAGQMGEASGEMIAAMREASDGTISNTDLMLAANRAMLLGVATTAEEMSQLLEVATARGRAMGLTTAQAFNDIVLGVGRESRLILDNLGIIVNLESANEAYAASLGKTANSLSDAERKQALLNQVLASSTDIVKANEAAGRDAAANFERMDASIQNAKEALGQLFQPAMVVVANAIADAAQAAADSMNEMAHIDSTNTLWAKGDDITRTLEAMEAAAQRMRDAGVSGDVAGLKEAANHIEMLRASLQAMGEQYNAAAAQTGAPLIDLAMLQQGNMAFQEMSVGLNNIEAAAGGASAALGMMNALAQEAFTIAVAQSRAIAAAIDSAAASSGALFAGKQGGDAGLARQQQVTAELQAQQRLWEEQGYTQKEIADVLMPGYVSQLREADNSLFRAASNTAMMSDAAQAAKQAFEDLKGTVAGVLSGALDPGVGVDPNDVLAALGLPREDAINENARRLADIAKNGLTGQDWLGDFANEVPDIWRMIRTAANPQEEAAYLLRDFQDGLLSSAIDKGKAKEIVKRQIMGDQNMAALAEEIARELAAEMGVPMQQALAAAQGTLGGGGMLGVGGESAQGFTDGANANLDETNAGGQFVDKFIAQARASYSALKTAGADGGKIWGDGFMAAVGENVPPQLIGLLVSLVTPGVMQAFAQQGTLTGADS